MKGPCNQNCITHGSITLHFLIPKQDNREDEYVSDRPPRSKTH
jgi:hypothetical protein